MRRMWWLGAGYVAGVSTAAWLRSKAKKTAQRYAPEHVREVVVTRIKDAGDKARHSMVDSSRQVGSEAKRVVDDIRRAASEGREAMKRAEGEMRGEAPA